MSDSDGDIDSSQLEGVTERTCPECGGVMYAEHGDRFCIECYHEGRV